MNQKFISLEDLERIAEYRLNKQQSKQKDILRLFLTKYLGHVPSEVEMDTRVEVVQESFKHFNEKVFRVHYDHKFIGYVRFNREGDTNTIRVSMKLNPTVTRPADGVKADMFTIDHESKVDKAFDEAFLNNIPGYKERLSTWNKEIDKLAYPSTKIQPDPNGRGKEIASMVTVDIHERVKKGIETYGEPLKAFNGRDPLMDAYQEAIDLVFYLRQAIEERGKNAD